MYEQQVRDFSHARVEKVKELKERGHCLGDKPIEQTIVSGEASLTNEGHRGAKVEQITVVEQQAYQR